MRPQNPLSLLASIFASALAGLIALGFQWLPHGRASDIEWHLAYMVSAAALVSTVLASVWIPVKRRGGKITGISTALLSSGLFSCLVAIGFSTIALTVGLKAFWMALMMISAPCAAVGAVVFHLAIEGGCRFVRASTRRFAPAQHEVDGRGGKKGASSWRPLHRRGKL